LNNRNIIVIIAGLAGLCVCGIVCVAGMASLGALSFLGTSGSTFLSTPPVISLATETATPGITVLRGTLTPAVNPTRSIPTPAINLPRSSPTPAIIFPRTTATVSFRRETPAASGGSTTVVFTDDFSGPCNLFEVDDDKHTFGCENNAYNMLNKTGTARWVYYTDEYTDLVLEVGAHVVSGPTFVEYGLVFRVAGDGKTFYGVTLTRDGKYTIWRCDNPCGGGSDFVDLIGYTPSSAVKAGTGTNHLKVVMQGNQIAAYVNDQWVNTVSDSNVDSGSVGLFINNSDPNAQVAFENLTISQINGRLTLPTGLPSATPKP
jgi:hypothetical protein